MSNSLVHSLDHFLNKSWCIFNCRTKGRVQLRVMCYDHTELTNSYFTISKIKN